MNHDQPHAFIARSRKSLTCICGRFLEHSLHYYPMPGLAIQQPAAASSAPLTLRQSASIDTDARKMEQLSPLFRGTAADPQNNLF